MKNSFYIIAPEDPTLDFLSPIYSDEHLGKFINGGIIKVGSCDEGYVLAKEQVLAIPSGSLVLFLGHGTSKSLLGINQTFEREVIWDLKSMASFKGQYLVLLSCHSSSLLKSSMPYRNNCDSVGFGLLPTDMLDVKPDRLLRGLELDQTDIDKYKSSLVKVFSEAFKYFLESNDVNLSDLAKYFRVFIDREIMALAHSSENRKVADIFVLMRAGLATH